MYDVVIVGAGIAGLGAARVLTRESHSVIVLEARSRPGGRIHSVRLPSTSVDFPITPAPSVNHDNLSVFHTVWNSQRTSIPDGSSNSQLPPEQPTNSSPRVIESSGECGSPASFIDHMGPVDVDLGANYLIGCSNRQTDQPLFHMARMLGVPTATCVGDLCKKYRGWECAELSTWRDHRKAGAPIIPLGTVAEAAFLFDKVVHLAVHKHLKLKAKLTKTNNESCHFSEYGVNEPSVKELLEESLQSILHSEASFGLRPYPVFRDEVESGVFHSILMRYLAYVNPIDRLPHTVLDELCEVATPRWHLSMNGSVLQSLGLHDISVHKLTLSDRLALAYPSGEQREAYLVWAERKLRALFSGQSGSCPSVARTVNVSWEDRLVTGRFSDLLRPLLENVTIVYNAIVHEINWALDGPRGEYVRVRALVRRADASSKSEFEQVTYEAKHCIVTVPVGVLKGLDSRSSINFIPELPRNKRDAIHRLGPPFPGAPTHEKVILRFRAPVDVFWDTQAAHLKCPDPRLHILNLHRYGKPGVLCAHIWGGSGLCPAGRSDHELVDSVLDLLDQMYPVTTTPGRKRGIPDPVYSLVTRWSEDPFSLGAYTTGEPGSSDSDRLLYAASLSRDDANSIDELNEQVSDRQSDGPKPCPRLLFAGEGTLTATEAKECTHGALQTGVLRALELLPFLHTSTSAQTSPRTLSKEGTHSRMLILNKLAQYLVGKPMPRWLAEMHSIEPRPGRANRKTRSIGRPVPNGANGIHPSLTDALDLNGVRTDLSRPHHERHASDSDDTLPLCIQKSPRPPKMKCGVAREHSNTTHARVLCQRPKRVRRTAYASRKRKCRTSHPSKRSTHHSPSDSSSATMEACSSTPIVLVEDSLIGQRCVKLAQFSSSLRELSTLWRFFTFSERQQILNDLADLLDELRIRHDELEHSNRSYAESSSLELRTCASQEIQIPSFPLD